MGIETFVRMAGGLPRNLVIVLKNVYRWAAFNGEAAFGADVISEASQRQGVIEAANWFWQDAAPMGLPGEEVQDAVSRLANLLRALRFADKPPEVSLAAFSVDESTLTAASREMLKVAREWSLLLRIAGGQKDRNTGALVAKYQVNPMIAPRWDLPVVRRGAIDLATSEADAIFDRDHISDYDAVVKARVQRATAPFRSRSTGNGSPQASLL
jgi:hypothetical protein